jgi:hypothetical protein
MLGLTPEGYHNLKEGWKRQTLHKRIKGYYKKCHPLTRKQIIDFMKQKREYEYTMIVQVVDTMIASGELPKVKA